MPVRVRDQRRRRAAVARRRGADRAGACRLPAGPARAAARRPHRDRLRDTSRAMLERGDLDRRELHGRALRLPPHRHLLAADGVGQLLGAGAWGAIATYRLPSLLGGILAVLSMWWLLRPLLGNRALAHCRRAVRRDADRGAAGDAVDPRGAAAAGDRRGAAHASAPLLRARRRPRQHRARAGLLGGAGLRHAAQRARRAHPFAGDDHRAVRLRPAARLAEAPAPAARRAAHARDRGAVDPRARALRRRAVQRAHLGRIPHARSAAPRT